MGEIDYWKDQIARGRISRRENLVNAHSKKLMHGELNSNFDHDGGDMYKCWWFA